ncbi:hypothetical protein V2J09_003314 [Rumex salicifolius]
MIFMYSPPSYNRRRRFWAELTQELLLIQGDLILGGDLNCILDSSVLSVKPLLGLEGILLPPMWLSALTESCAQLLWPNAKVRHLPKSGFDHTPLLLILEPRSAGNRHRRPFRFEAAWLSHHDFNNFLEAIWTYSSSASPSLARLRPKLLAWNRECFGNIETRKAKLFDQIDEVHNKIGVAVSDDLLAENEMLLKELDLVLSQEETLWKQKSRELWLLCGDRNTSYFHASTIIRRRRNRVEALKTENDRWIYDQTELEELVVNYFRNLYHVPLEELNPITMPHGHFPILETNVWRDLTLPVLDDEIKEAVNQMGALKAPGRDGFQPIFFQKCWSIVKGGMVREIRDFFRSCQLHSGLNDTLIALIPKVKAPELFSQFRPISLCNVIYKIITKVLVRRLQPLLADLISSTQGSFIPGRIITDNIVLAQEVVHSMRFKKGRKGWMVLKVDLEKAYDRLR